MKNLRKKLLITGVIIVMGLMTVGCGKDAENTDGSGASVAEAEDLPAPENGEDKAAENGEAPAVENPENGQSGDAAGREEDGAPSLRYIPDTEGDLLGDIWEIGDMEFTVTEIEVYTETAEEGGGTVQVAVAVGEEDEAAKIKVVYDEDTVFEKQKIWNGGADHEEREGTAADLQKGFNAEMWGSYEGDVFHATAIRVIEVVL